MTDARQFRIVRSDRETRVPSWDEIARTYGRFLYTVSYRLTGNHDDAQDLVQEVLVRVERGLATYVPGRMEGWLSRIATNAFLDDVRRRKRRPVEPLPDDPERVLVGAPSAEQAAATEALPEEIQTAIRQLVPDFRAVLVLSDVVGMSYQEIADSLELPIGTVRSRLHRARLQLRESLGHLGTPR